MKPHHKHPVLVLLLMSAACPSSGPRYVPDLDRSKGLPDNPRKLIELADRLTHVPMAEKPPPLSRTDRAVAALEKALTTAPQYSFEIQWRLARGCFLMTEALGARSQSHGYAVRGVEYARQARSLNERRVEPHYFLALNMAKVAEATSDVHLVKAMVEPARQAAKIDMTYDDAGPLRFLGKVYLTAPAWPVSVGNPDKALETLARAVKAAPVPLNRVFLGQAYYQDEEYEAAEQQLRLALRDARASKLAERWKKEARDYLNRIAAGASSDPRTSF